MNFNPQNRYLLVQTQAQEDAENTGVLLPEGYSDSQRQVCYGNGSGFAADCKRDCLWRKLFIKEGSKVVVDSIYG
jgi:co-chaperonin GroES (HSP10)